MPLSTLDIMGAWLSIFLTLCILSFLFEDNPIYKFAEHLFMGVGTAVAIIEEYYGTFAPKLVDKLADHHWLSLVPLVLSALLFAKLFRNGDWLARIPIAFIVAVFAGLKLTGEANASLMTQVAQTMVDLGKLYRDFGLASMENDYNGVFSGLVLVFGLAACLLHFYFSAAHNRPMKVVSRVGVLVLMLSFGASFGYTVMGRISLAIARAEELLGRDRPPAEVAQIHPQMASVVSALVVIGVLVVWKRGQTKPAEG